MHGRGHQVGIKAHDKGLMLSILRYGNEVRDAEPYFERVTAKPGTEGVALAKELIERMSGRFQPEKMPDEYARAVHELVKAKVEHRAPEVQIGPQGKLTAPVINIMDALKASMQKQGQAKVRDAVRKRMGKAAPKDEASRQVRSQSRGRAGSGAACIRSSLRNRKQRNGNGPALSWGRGRSSFMVGSPQCRLGEACAPVPTNSLTAGNTARC